MKPTAVIVAPGRGTYNKAELGYLAARHASQADLQKAFDDYRKSEGQEPLSALDGAGRFETARHTRGDNASALIYASAYFDFLSLADRYDIVGVTGNSMGWYIALACAGALDAMGGLRVVNTMGTLMHEKGVGGQLVYPFLDDDWRPVPGAREQIMAKAAQINAREGHALRLSIDLGGMLVLAGDAAGLAAFETEMPRLEGRYPMRLPGHVAFHTDLLAHVAEAGRGALAPSLFGQPALPMIDGRGAIWRPGMCDLSALYDYTLGAQVTQTYDFTAAVRVAARELMPDFFVVLGPGKTLGGAVAQSLALSNWRGEGNKQAVKDAGRVVMLG